MKAYLILSSQGENYVCQSIPCNTVVARIGLHITKRAAGVVSRMWRRTGRLAARVGLLCPPDDKYLDTLLFGPHAFPRIMAYGSWHGSPDHLHHAVRSLNTTIRNQCIVATMLQHAQQS
jgi:hypothetical protein